MAEPSSEEKFDGATSVGASAEVTEALRQYLALVVPVLLDADADQFRAALLRVTAEINSFASDALCLLIRKSSPSDEASEASFSFDLEIKSSGGSGAGKGGMAIAIMRRSGQLDASTTMAAQVFVCQVNDAAPLGAQCAVMEFALQLFLIPFRF